MKKFLSNLGWVTFGATISTLLMFVTNLAAGRWLGPSEYGKYALIISLGQILVLPMTLGLNTAMIRYAAHSDFVEQKKRVISSAFYPIMIFTVVTTFTILFFSKPFSKLIKVDQIIFIFAAIYTTIMALNYSLEAILKGLHKFKLISFLTISNALTVFVVFFSYTRITHDYSFRSYTVAISSGLLVYSIAAFWVNRPMLRDFVMPQFKTLLKYGLYALLGGIAGFAFSNTDRFVINTYLGTSTVGLYAAYAGAASFLPGQFQQIFNNVFFPSISSIRKKGEAARKLKKILTLSFIPITVANVFVVALILRLYGSKYEFNWYYTIIFALVNSMVLVESIYGWFIISFGKKGVRFSTTASLLAGIFNILLMLVLIPRVGILGSIIGLGITMTILINVFLYYAKLNSDNADE